MAGTFKVSWTEEASNQVNQILKYLRENWSENECEDFLDLLLHLRRQYLYSLIDLRNQRNIKIVDSDLVKGILQLFTKYQRNR